MRSLSRILHGAILILGVANGCSAFARVELENHQGRSLSLATPFADESGATLPLARYFHQGKPVVLALVYFGCPGPCTLLLNNFVRELKSVSPSAGSDFELVVVSLDPRETPALARAKEENYLKMYGRIGAEKGWHFLTGTEESIQKLSGELGFYFERSAETGLILHPSAVFFLSESGVLSGTLGGVHFSKRDIVASLYDSSHGWLARWVERASVVCGPYVETAWAGRAAMGFGLALLGLIFLWKFLRVMLLGESS